MKDTREHILKSAFLLFLQNNYKSVTLRDIIKASGLSNGTFYHHFKSKEQVFKEAVDYIMFRMSRRIFEYYPKDTLWNFIQDTLSDMENNSIELNEFLGIDENINQLSFIIEAIKYFPELKEEVVRIRSTELRSWMEILEIAKQSGEISSELSNDLLAKMFIYISRGNDLESTNNRTLWDGLYDTLKTRK